MWAGRGRREPQGTCSQTRRRPPAGRSTRGGTPPAPLKGRGRVRREEGAQAAAVCLSPCALNRYDPVSPVSLYTWLMSCGRRLRTDSVLDSPKSPGEERRQGRREEGVSVSRYLKPQRPSLSPSQGRADLEPHADCDHQVVRLQVSVQHLCGRRRAAAAHSASATAAPPAIDRSSSSSSSPPAARLLTGLGVRPCR